MEFVLIRHGRIMRPKFLNVDLEIESTVPLDALAKAMGKKIIVLHSGLIPKSRRNLLALESSRFLKTPDAAIHSLCAVVEGLPTAAMNTWRVARSRKFDVGFELRLTERASGFSFRPDTLLRVSRLGASLAVTYHRGGGEDD